jgi:hypothetical protein
MRTSGWAAVLALVSASAVSGAAEVRQAPVVNPTGAAVLAFKQRLADYVKVHKQADAGSRASPRPGIRPRFPSGRSRSVTLSAAFAPARSQATSLSRRSVRC